MKSQIGSSSKCWEERKPRIYRYVEARETANHRSFTLLLFIASCDQKPRLTGESTVVDFLLLLMYYNSRLQSQFIG